MLHFCYYLNIPFEYLQVPMQIAILALITHYSNHRFLYVILEAVTFWGVGTRLHSIYYP